MGVSINTRKSYSEIDEFLGLLSEEQRNKIPQKLRDFFKEEKDPNYKKGINSNDPIKNQNLKEETLGIIALLNLQYWCEDENEKQRLKEVYARNEKKYQEILREQYNPDNIFKKKQEKIIIEEKNLIPYKENIIRKIFNKIKKIFLKNKKNV